MRNDSQPSDDAADARWEALARYAAGESSASEAATVREWLDAHPADAALIELVRAGLESPVPAPAVDVEGALARVRSVIDGSGSMAAESTQSASSARPPLRVVRGDATRRPDRARYGPRHGVGLAAAALVLLAIGFGTRRAARLGDDAPAVATAARIYRTAVGVRDSIVLADGSRVILAPGSGLTVSADFETSRTVTLEGAAFFDVKHDEQRPFTVRSGRALIRDVGTAFSVNTDATGAVVVAVTEGIVAMAPASAPQNGGVELRAGDRGVLQPEVLPTGAAPGGNAPDIVQVSRGSVTADDVAWTRGELTYHDAPLSVVQADLERWYGIKLSVTDTMLLRQTLKISFRGDSAAGAVRKIALALGAETVQRGDSVILRMPGRSTAPSSDR